MLEKVYTSNAPEAIGPYSQAIICGNMLFTSGQVPINPATGNVETEGITDQATQVMKNLAAVLEEAGTTFEKVVKTTCFLSDMADFVAFNAVYALTVVFRSSRSTTSTPLLLPINSAI